MGVPGIELESRIEYYYLLIFRGGLKDLGTADGMPTGN